MWNVIVTHTLLLQDLLQTKDKKIETDVVILDFSKAFDMVPHDRLLGELEFLGIHGPLLDWTAALLKTREQIVLVDGSKSCPTKVISGVPQGTVLGSLLFLMHINDLASVVTTQVRLFADECLMYRTIRSIADHVALQQDLAALELWGDTWGVRFNAGQCHIMHISRSRAPMSFMYELCVQVIFSVEEDQYRGVTLTSELSCPRANVSLGFLTRNLKHCPSHQKETAYIAIVRSVLEYACPIWDSHLRKDVDLFQSVQSRAARFVNSDYRSTSSVTSMLQSLGWKNLEDRWRDVRLALLFKIIHGHQKYDVIHSLEGEQCHSKGLSYLPICRIFWQSSRWPIQSRFENVAHPDDVPTTDIIRGTEGHVEISVAPHYYWLVTLWDIEKIVVFCIRLSASDS